MYKRKKRHFNVLLLAILLATVFAGSQIGQYLTSYPKTHTPLNDAAQIINRGRDFKETQNTVTLNEEIYSAKAILIDLSNHEILCEKASNDMAYPASLTKIMTSIIAIENLSDLEERISLSRDIFDDLDQTDASMAGFAPNEEVMAIDLLYATMLPSGAETAIALADHISGSEKDFVKLMNRKADSLGMENTHFTNVTGLHHWNHYTTAKDMAVLLEYALQNETFREIFTRKSYCIHSTNLKPSGFSFQSTMFQEMASAEFDGGEILGGKTGYTNEAGLCLASLAEKNGQEYILITMGANGNHESEQYNITDALYIYSQY